MQGRGTYKLFKIVLIIFFIVYIFCLAFLTLFSRFYGRGYLHHGINIIPLRTITQYLTQSSNRNITITNIWGNIEAFIPMGFLLPIIFKKLNKFKKVFASVLIVSLLIEVLQYITGTGASDIDDVILNVLGGILGYLIYKVFRKLFILLKYRHKLHKE